MLHHYFFWISALPFGHSFIMMRALAFLFALVGPSVSLPPTGTESDILPPLDVVALTTKYFQVRLPGMLRALRMHDAATLQR